MRLEEVPWEGWKNPQRIEDMLEEKYISKGTNGKHNLGRFKSDSTSQLQYFTKLSEWWNIRNEECATPLMVRREQANKPMDFDIVLAEPLPNPINPALAQKVAAYKETCNHVRKSSVQVGTSKAYPLEHLHMEIMGTVKALTSSKQIDDMPSVDIFMCMLQKCTEIKKLACAKHVHILICDYGLEAFGALGNYFVLMFLECGSVFDAQQAFNRLVHQNELSWTSLIHGYIESGEWWHAPNLLQQIRGDCEYASSCNFVVLLKACANRKWMKRGQELHTEIAKEACERELIIGTALLDMYAKCGALAEAQDVFDKLVVRDVVSWTALIGGYADHRLGEEALGCLEQMQLEGVPMNAFTYVCSLKACSGIGDITRGRKLHAKIAKDGLERDYFVCSTLVNMYAEFGLLVEARRVLDKLPVIHVVSWNALITGYVEHGFGQEALRCLEQMQAEGVSPNAITHVCSLKACGSIGAIDKGREIHAAVNKEGLEGDLFIGSTLVDMYAACGSLAEAQEVFGQLPVRDVVSWTALIGGYIGHGLGKEAISCLEQMQLEGISPNGVTFVCSLKACGSQGSVDKGRELHFEIAKEGFERDPFVGNTLVDMYAKCGSLVEALEVFDELPVCNVVSWNALIAAYSEHGLCEEALNCLEQMEVEFMSPDAVTYVSCLKACGSIGAMERGRELHAKIVKEGFERDPFLCGTLVEIYSAGRRNPSVETHGASERESIILVLANALIDMYGKCGSMVDSQKVFDAMPTRDLLTWTGLVTGYSRQGECKLVFHLFERMRKEGIQPDGITFLSLLNVCSHVGLLDKGQKYFEMMSNYGITKTIEHHNCMVDLFGRAGLFDKAMVVLEEMPFEPDPVTWSTMLCACRRWGTVELGRQAFKYAAEMKESGATAFVLMSNMYAAAHMCED